jgi:hypothetical protein
MILDLLRIAWLGVVTALLLWGFGAGRRGVRKDPAARIALIARAVVVLVLAVNVLSRLHVFNAATLLAACFVWPIARWLKRDRWAAEHAVRTVMRESVLEAVRRAEQPLSSWVVVRWARRARRHAVARMLIARERMDRFSAVEIALAAAASAALAAGVYLRLGPVLGETRLGDPRLYETLLNARQALFNAPGGIVPVVSAVGAALTTLASIHTLHIVRLAAPLAAIGTIVVGAALIRRITRSVAAAVIAMALLVVLMPPFTGEADVALLFALLAALSAAWRTPASRHACAACVGVALLALTRVDPAGIARVVLPAAIALGAGAAYAGLALLVSRLKPLRIDMAAAPLACAALIVLLPQNSGALYLEYPAAQAQTLDMAARLPRGKWLLVAPIEQLAESYGRGWYEEPSAFVARYSSRAGDPAFTFDLAVEDVLVLVEKRPFKTFTSEAAAVPFSTLTDPTYRNYRSLAGRASLQAQLRELCEAYRRTHEGASIHYEDDDLTIYRFRLRG